MFSFLLLPFWIGCGPSSSETAIDEVNFLISSSDCADALNDVLSIYDSASTNNDIRMATASAYGCYANVNIMKNINDIINFQGSLEGSGFWQYLVKEFPDSKGTVDNTTDLAARNGIDAALATLNYGTILDSTYTVNSTSYNPGSILSTDHTTTSNALLTFLAMAQAGSMLNRNGQPNSSGSPTQSLPWISATGTNGDGCAFASALLLLSDSISTMSTIASSKAASTYSKVGNFLSAGLAAACQTGCITCGGSVSCTSCPTTLRNRSSCTGESTDENSCAAAGIATFVYDSWSGSL